MNDSRKRIWDELRARGSKAIIHNLGPVALSQWYTPALSETEVTIKKPCVRATEIYAFWPWAMIMRGEPGDIFIMKPIMVDAITSRSNIIVNT